jgi:hypothetical protein
MGLKSGRICFQTLCLLKDHRDFSFHFRLEIKTKSYKIGENDANMQQVEF